MARKPLSKRTRFEIFKRDGFRCVYCGRTPVQSVLHVDHVTPVAAGGGNEPENLATACTDCNHGKSAVPLDAKRFTPGESPEAILDHAEQIRAYLNAHKEANAARSAAQDVIHRYWNEKVGAMERGLYNQLPKLMAEWSHETIIAAIDAVERGLGGQEASVGKTARYFQGILRNWREGR